MTTQTQTYDVFLSYSFTEGSTANLVERALTEAGLDVFTPSKVQATEDLEDALWRALAECAAVVAVLAPDRAPGSSTSVELGAAIAWHKPICIVHAEAASVRLPKYLSDFATYPISRIDDVVQSVMRTLRPLSKEDRAALCDIYMELGIPADNLLREPDAVEALARAFHSRRRKRTSGERLVQELIRLRKGGHLPRLVKA